MGLKAIGFVFAYICTEDDDKTSERNTGLTGRNHRLVAFPGRLEVEYPQEVDI